ncbi:MAG: hypothetical protein REI94_07715 [Moraxellaceae bacterium]|nr:hypothetical protein [Moraxellaceae bacterium]
MRNNPTPARRDCSALIKGGLLAVICSASSLAHADWASTQGVQHFCSGVGLESRDAMASAGAANAKIMLTAGKEGGYLSDVQLTVSGGTLPQPASWQSTGPICLLKLPAGRYQVDADYEGERRTGTLNVPPVQSSNPPSLMLNFPAE